MGCQDSYHGLFLWRTWSHSTVQSEHWSDPSSLLVLSVPETFISNRASSNFDGGIPRPPREPDFHCRSSHLMDITCTMLSATTPAWSATVSHSYVASRDRGSLWPRHWYVLCSKIIDVPDLSNGQSFHTIQNQLKSKNWQTRLHQKKVIKRVKRQPLGHEKKIASYLSYRKYPEYEKIFLKTQVIQLKFDN